MKIIRVFIGIITGLLFVFSGFVKAIDPLGSAYKFSDYFQAFHINFLKSLALPLAILLITAEFVTGISILLGLRRKEGISVALLLMIFFTPLTFILALTNPVSDCGCFGDAIHLTNWQTFGKNIILLIFTLILFAGRKSLKQLFKPLTEWILFLCITIAIIAFSLYNLKYLPVVDFLPYKTGTSIPEKMLIPAGAPSDQYVTTFIYEKDGTKKEFTINDYPSNDSSWKFVEQKSQLTKKGYVPPIHDFSIVTMENEDITDLILLNPGYTVLMISKKLTESDSKNLTEGFELGEYCNLRGINFVILTASGTDEVKKYENRLKFCKSDETTLKTIIRSNPGYLLIKDGIIIGKWSWAKMSELRKFLENNSDKN